MRCARGRQINECASKHTKQTPHHLLRSSVIFTEKLLFKQILILLKAWRWRTLCCLSSFSGIIVMHLCFACLKFLIMADVEPTRQQNRQGPTFFIHHRNHSFFYKHLQHCRVNGCRATKEEFVRLPAFEGPRILQFWGQGKIERHWLRDVARFAEFIQTGNGMHCFVVVELNYLNVTNTISSLRSLDTTAAWNCRA